MYVMVTTEGFGCPIVFGFVNNPCLSIQCIFFWYAANALLGARSGALALKTGPDDIPRQVFHGGFITGQNPPPDEHVETGVPPFIHQRDQVPADLSFFQKHLRHVMLEQQFQHFGIY